MRCLSAGELARVALTLLVGALGAFLAGLAGFPAPFLTGPAIAVTLAALARLKPMVPETLGNACLIVIGMSIGAGVTPDVVETARQWPASFIALALALVVIMAACVGTLRRLFGYDRVTAVLASSPGHLSYVLGLSTDVKADIRAVSLVQSIRVLCITLVVPFGVAMLGGDIEASAAPPTPMPLAAIALTFIASLALGLLLQLVRVPAALLIGAMLVSSLTHLGGFVEGGVPEWLGVPAFLIMGAMIGSRFTGVTLAMVGTAASAGLMVTAIASAVAAGSAVAVAGLLGLPMGQLLIAFMPGGVEAMIALAVIMGADPAFVASHHVMRLFILTLLVPLMLGRKHGAV